MLGKPIDDDTLIKFWIGDVLHAAVQKALSDEAAAEIVGHEVLVRDDEYRVSGHADTVARTGTGVGIVEIKSIDGNAFRYGKLPYEHHQHQGVTYMTFHPDRPELVWFLYIGKNGHVEEYVIRSSPEVTGYIRDYITRLTALYAQYELDGTLPPALDEPKTDARAKWCDYLGSGLCCADKGKHGGEEAEQADQRDEGEPHAGAAGAPRKGRSRAKAPEAAGQA